MARDRLLATGGAAAWGATHWARGTWAAMLPSRPAVRLNLPALRQPGSGRILYKTAPYCNARARRQRRLAARWPQCWPPCCRPSPPPLCRTAQRTTPHAHPTCTLQARPAPQPRPHSQVGPMHAHFTLHYPNPCPKWAPSLTHLPQQLLHRVAPRHAGTGLHVDEDVVHRHDEVTVLIVVPVVPHRNTATPRHAQARTHTHGPARHVTGAWAAAMHGMHACIHAAHANHAPPITGTQALLACGIDMQSCIVVLQAVGNTMCAHTSTCGQAHDNGTHVQGMHTLSAIVHACLQAVPAAHPSFLTPAEGFVSTRRGLAFKL